MSSRSTAATIRRPEAYESLSTESIGGQLVRLTEALNWREPADHTRESLNQLAQMVCELRQTMILALRDSSLSLDPVLRVGMTHLCSLMEKASMIQLNPIHKETWDNDRQYRDRVLLEPRSAAGTLQALGRLLKEFSGHSN